MLRYLAAAAGLKLFSMNRITKRAYRYIGNQVGGPLGRKEKYIQSHMLRGDLFRSLIKKYGLDQGGNTLLEIGTGWVHWHSVYHNIYYNDHITMFDIWDCRQLNAFKELFGALKEEIIKQGLDMSGDVMRRLNFVCSVKSFNELYHKMNLSYNINEAGSLHQFPDNKFDCIFSFHVLEHVKKDNTDILINDIYRKLKPGGYSIHQIGIDDHLAHYDSSVSQKKYICFSDLVWRNIFENNIQYFNRLQMSEWINSFEKNNFKLLDKLPQYCDISDLNVNRRFKKYSEQDLRCTTLTIIHQKPLMQGKL